MLGAMPPSVCSPVLEEPTPLVSSVVMDDIVILEGEMHEPSDVVPDVIPPPPDCPPFSFYILYVIIIMYEQPGLKCNL